MFTAVNHDRQGPTYFIRQSFSDGLKILYLSQKSTGNMGNLN